MCRVALRRGWRTCDCHSSTMLWEWQSDVLQPLFRQWQDCITVTLLKKRILGWKQKNHDKRVFESYLLCVCPAFIMGRMCPFSLWLGLLCFGHAFACRWRMEHNETPYHNKEINKWGKKILLGLLFWKDQSNAGHGKRQVAVPKLCFTFKLIWNQNITLAQGVRMYINTGSQIRGNEKCQFKT